MSTHPATGTSGTGTGGSAGRTPDAGGELPTDIDPLDHAERGALAPAGPGSLADQPERSDGLLDADGDDVREYTGEPVETDEGWVIPQSQNVGDAPPATA